MALSPDLLPALKADILANAGSGGPLQAMLAANDYNGIAAYYKADAAPVFWVWRTNVTREEIYNSTSADNTSWDWAIYKAQAVPEQNAWTQMFMGDRANFAQANLRAGIGKIFGAANAQTVHALAVGRRRANRGEKLYATGAGSAVSPAIMSFEGSIEASDVNDAVRL